MKHLKYDFRELWGPRQALLKTDSYKHSAKRDKIIHFYKKEVGGKEYFPIR